MRSTVLALLCVIVLGASGCADPEGSGGQRPAAARAAKQGVQHRMVEQRQTIPFRTQTRRTGALRKGTARVIRPGRPGVRVTVFRVTTRNGETISRKRVRTEVRRQAAPRVVLVGTLQPYVPRCDSNYSGGCVPVASDVDCRGGSGNGPAYVSGTVRVVGHDIYGLDADRDGWGCD